MATDYQQRERVLRRDYESQSAYYETIPTSTPTTTYRSSLAPRSSSLSRTRTSRTNYNVLPSRLPTYSVPLRTSMASSTLVLSGPNAAVGAINAARKREKRELVELNDKFAQYVEKIRFLDAQNRKLHKELEALESRASPRSSNVKDMYEIEMNEARRLLDQTEREANDAQELGKKNAEDLRRLQAQYDASLGARQTDQREVANLQARIAENEAQIALLRRRLDDIEDEIRLYREETQRVSSEINRLQNDIEQEGFSRNGAEQDKIRAEDELATLKQQQNEKLDEIRSQNISSDLDPTRFFRNELASAIRDIREAYEDEMREYQDRLQFQYALLVNQYPQLNAARLPQAQPIEDSNDPRHRQLQDQLINERDSYRRQIAEKETLETQVKNLHEDLDRLNVQTRALDNMYDDEDFARLLERKTRVERDYKEVSELRTNLQKELGRYRELLEGRDGLQGCVYRIEQQARGALTGSLNNDDTYLEASAPAQPPPVTTPTVAPGPPPSSNPTSQTEKSSTQRAPQTPQSSSGGYVSRTYINQGLKSPPPSLQPTNPTMSTLTGQLSGSSSVYQRLTDAPRRQGSTRDSPPLSRSQSRDDQGDYYATRESVLRTGSTSSNRNSRVYESSYSSRASLLRDESRFEDQGGSNYDTYENA